MAKFKHAAIRIRTEEPNYSYLPDPEYDWAHTVYGNAKAQVEARLAQEGWTLLNVLSLFGDDGLAERKSSTGRYFLRF